jgi:hypothetical protein
MNARLFGRGVPRRGYRTQPRVSTLGTLENKRFAPKGREMRPPGESCSYYRAKSAATALDAEM